MSQGTESLSVMRRMTLSMMGVLATCVCAALLLWSAAEQYRGQSQDIVPAMRTVLTVMADVRQTRLLEAQLQAARTEGAQRAAAEVLAQQQQSLAKRLDAYRPLDPLDRQWHRDVRQAATAHWAAQQDLMAALRRAPETSGLVDTSAAQRTYDRVASTVEGWRRHGETLAEVTMDDGSMPWQAGLGAALLVVAACWMWRAVTSTALAIREPLAQAQLALKAVARGEVDYRINVKRLDEFGHLLVAIDGLRDTLALSASDDESKAALPAPDVRRVATSLAQPSEQSTARSLQVPSTAAA